MLDVYRYGSVCAVVLVQLFISVALLVALPFCFANILHAPTITSGTSVIRIYVASLFPILAFIPTLYLIYLIADAWIHGPEGSWKRGVKDLHNDIQQECSLFGQNRPDDDDTREFARKVATGSNEYLTRLREWLKLVIFRRIECVLNFDAVGLFHLTEV